MQLEFIRTRELRLIHDWFRKHASNYSSLENGQFLAASSPSARSELGLNALTRTVFHPPVWRAGVVFEIRVDAPVDFTGARHWISPIAPESAPGARMRQTEIRFGLRDLRAQADFLRASGWSNFRAEEETVTAVGRFHLRALTRQQESIVNVELEIQKAPRGGLNPNRGFVELGAFRTKSLRRLPQIEMFKWNSKSDTVRVESEPAKPKRDRMHLARQHQALMNSGDFESQAALARYLGVSRARVTQVLKRLVESDSDTQSKTA